MSHTIEFSLYPSALGLDIFGPLEVFNTATEALKADQKKAVVIVPGLLQPKKGLSDWVPDLRL